MGDHARGRGPAARGELSLQARERAQLLGFALVGPLARATSISAVAIGAGVLLTVASLSVIAVPSIRGLRADGTDGSRAVAQ